MNSDRSLNIILKKKSNLDIYSINYINPSFILNKASIGCLLSGKINRTKMSKRLDEDSHPIRNIFKTNFYFEYKLFDNNFIKIGVGSEFFSLRLSGVKPQSVWMTSYLLNHGAIYNSYFVFIELMHRGINKKNYFSQIWILYFFKISV